MRLPSGSGAAEATPSARKIMEDVYRQNTSHDIAMKANFQVYDRQGHGEKKEFIYRRIGSAGDTRTLVVFTAPKEIRGVALLAIDKPDNRGGASGAQYLYTPATDRVRSVAPQERSARFIGTDFTFEDITDKNPEDFSYRLLGDAETIEGHKTYKVEATPLDAARSQYKFIYYWVAQDIPVFVHEELYDAQGREVRVLHASQFKREGGIWGARRTEMRTLGDGTRTVLTIEEVKFNSKPDEKIFTPQGLAGAFGAALK